MKQIQSFSSRLLMLAVMMTFVCTPVILCSCGDDDDDDNNSPSKETYEAKGFDAPKYEKQSALYKITSGESNLYSIEFTPTGDYIILDVVYFDDDDDDVAYVKSATKHFAPRTTLRRAPASDTYNGMQCGHYTTTGDGTYKLDGYGTIVVTGGEKNAVKLTITLLNGKKIEVGAQKKNQYSASSTTNALCRKWDFGKVVVHKASGDVTYASVTDFDRYEEEYWSEEEAEDEPVQVLFTKSGSYIVFYADQELDVATWAWTDEKTGAARYSWDWNNLYGDESGPIYFAFEGKQLLITAPEEDDEYADYESVTYYCTEAK